MCVRNRCAPKGSHLLGEHNLHSRNMCARNRGAPKGDHLLGEHNLHSRNMCARNRGEVSPAIRGLDGSPE